MGSSSLLLFSLCLSTSVSFSSLSPPASLRVSPDRLQFIQLESLSLRCEEQQGTSTGWRVKRNTASGGASGCGEKDEEREVRGRPGVSSCNISYIIPKDSGVYWCESDSGERSPAVNITVTAGAVILESPVLPVTEGEAVTLLCLYNTTPSDLTADFYKDGYLIRTESTRKMIIPAVSRSDEGLYKCNHSNLGESPESWLALRDQPSSPSLVLLVVGLFVFLVVVIVIVQLIVVLLWVLLCFNKKSKDSARAKEDIINPELNHKGKKTPQKKRKQDNREAARAEDVTYADVNVSKTPRRKRERPVGGRDPVYSAVRTDTPPDTARAKEDVTYSDINHKGKRTPQKKRDGAVPELVYAAVRIGP